MNWNKHYDIEGQHAFLGASRYHWVNYDDNKIVDTWNKRKSVEQGTELHEFAATCIRLRQRLPKEQKTLNMYVNDAISLRMTPEQVLYYSENCFGTADAISFRNNTLHIHDLKTGSAPAHVEQLEIYAALFCVEYGKNPSDINIEMRIYQYDDVQVFTADPNHIIDIIQKIYRFDVLIEKLKEKER